jgi:hypothetical protein
MFRKSIYIITFVLLFGLALTAPARAELVAWWKLDEGAGNIAYDSSGNDNNGTIEGTAQWAEGKLGGAWLGNGSNAFIRVPHSDSLMINDAITVTLWLNGGVPPDQVICKSDGTGTGWQSNYAIRLEDQAPARRVNWRGRATANQSLTSVSPLANNEWVHLACTFDISEATNKIYINGVLDAENTATLPLSPGSGDLYLGADQYPANGARWWFQGMLDDIRIYNEALPEGQILTIMQGGGAEYPFAYRPNPADGALYEDTWVSLGWQPGDFAVSHDVYFGEDFNDVNDGLGDTFRGNYTSLFFIVGFPGYPYPDGLVPGTTYYWRIDEVNQSEPNSPWKGKVWSFTIPSKKAYTPVPADGAEFVDTGVRLRWTAGLDAKLHTVYFGEDFETVANAVGGSLQGDATYNPGPLKLAKTYYWRVDEFDSVNTYKGDVWSFTTEGAVSGPNPANGAVDVKPTVVLSWIAGGVAASHDVYFGMDADAVADATKGSSEYKGPKALGEERYDPGKLILNTTYYWRIDEVNGVNPDSPWIGNVWNFETGNFFVLDDFESYDSNDNQIWYTWHDGLGYGAQGVDPYFAGNGTGAAVGDESTASYTEETIVHSGGQSMPLGFDNNKQGFAKYSEVEMTMTTQKDWTEQGLTELSLWFRGNPASVGSFVEGPVGTYTMTSTGADIWNAADQFHYAFKTLTGPGSIVARVLSVDNTDPWAKAGVMIRETLGAGSKFAAVYITPGNGCRFQARLDTDVAATSDTSVVIAEQTAITSPYWIKLERDVAGNFRGYYSADGAAWRQMAWNPQNISMSANVYIGLAVTSHNNNAVCQVQFSNVTITGTVGQQWSDQDIGITSNDAEPLYVAVSNSTGTPAVVVHNDPAAANIVTWTEWIIPLQAFADQGIVLTSVDRIAIGLGTRGNMTVPGGSGKMYIDDIRLYQPRGAAE